MNKKLKTKSIFLITTFCGVLCLLLSLMISYWQKEARTSETILNPKISSLSSMLFYVSFLSILWFWIMLFIKRKVLSDSWKKKSAFVGLQIFLIMSFIFIALAKTFDWNFLKAANCSVSSQSPDSKKTVYLCEFFLDCKLYEENGFEIVLRKVEFRSFDCKIKNYGLKIKWSPDSESFDVVNLNNEPHKIPEESLQHVFGGGWN